MTPGDKPGQSGICLDGLSSGIKSDILILGIYKTLHVIIHIKTQEKTGQNRMWHRYGCINQYGRGKKKRTCSQGKPSSTDGQGTTYDWSDF